MRCMLHAQPTPPANRGVRSLQLREWGGRLRAHLQLRVVLLLLLLLLLLLHCCCGAAGVRAERSRLHGCRRRRRRGRRRRLALQRRHFGHQRRFALAQLGKAALQLGALLNVLACERSSDSSVPRG